ncbi:MAG TPA: hypothetical protein VN408_21040 [Actinoplanes sp.]|nr:hypothetical protein [Actinoplanes sp.]
MNDQLRAALRAAADEHRPDREAMLDRINAGRTGRRHVARPGARGRGALIGAVAFAVFGGGGVGTWALAASFNRAEPPPAPLPPVVATPSPVDTAPVSVAPSPSAAATTLPPPVTSPSPVSSPTSPSPSASPSVQATNPLWADGSVVSTGSSVVTLTTTTELTSLTVEIRLARTDGLTARSGAKKTPGASVTSTVIEEPDAFVYRFVMAPSDTLGPGTYTFTARYTHPDGGRDAGGDTYQAVSGDLQVSGDFF